MLTMPIPISCGTVGTSPVTGTPMISENAGTSAGKIAARPAPRTRHRLAVSDHRHGAREQSLDDDLGSERPDANGGETVRRVE